MACGGDLGREETFEARERAPAPAGTPAGVPADVPAPLGPGAFALTARGLAAAAIAADPTTGDLYAFGRLTDWSVFRVSGGVVARFDVPPPRCAGLYPYAGTDLELRRGFGGADLFSADIRGKTIALSAPHGANGRVFAETRGGESAGLAFAGDALFVSSGTGAPRAIVRVTARGEVEPFMGPAELSADPTSLAATSDGATLHYSTAGGELVTIDVDAAAEVARVRLAEDQDRAPNIAVEPATGDVFAVVHTTPHHLERYAIVRYRVASGRVETFAADLPGANDLAFGPCATGWCLFVSGSEGILQLGGFSPPARPAQ